MDEVAVCRRAARDAVRDIEPDRLRAVMDDLIAEASMTPGALTLRAADAARRAETGAVLDVEVDADGDPGTRADGDGGRAGATVADGVTEQAAGVQLIYEGLRLIRELAGDDPWGDGDHDRTEENLAVLAADVLVSRGFYLLARTSAADKAVETVRNFGRDQTLSRDHGASEGDPDRGHDRNLEVDVLQLALLAGTAGVAGVSPTPAAQSAVAALARSTDGPLPPVDTVLGGVRVATTDANVDVEAGDGEEPTRTSATDS